MSNELRKNYPAAVGLVTSQANMAASFEWASEHNKTLQRNVESLEGKLLAAMFKATKESAEETM